MEHFFNQAPFEVDICHYKKSVQSAYFDVLLLAFLVNEIPAAFVKRLLVFP